MPSLNRLEIIGNVGVEPEMRFTANGTAVTNFTVAVNYKYKKDGKEVEDTDWFNVIAWRRLAELANQFVTKGMMVFVTGRVSLHTWDKEKGGTGSRIDLSASNIIFLSKSTAKDVPDDVVPEDENIPF